MNENQRIRSGNDSENYQSAGDLTVNNTHGISYEAAKDIAMTVFENNFLKLGEQVEEIVNERAEKLINDYLEKIRSEKPEALINTTDPDIRAGIYEAQRDYARSGKEEVEKLLVDILVERTIDVSSDFKNTIMNEALSIASKLNKIQIDLLTVSFLGRYVSFNNPTNPNTFNELLQPFEYLLRSNVDKLSDYTFLSYLGCMDLSIGSVSFETVITSKKLVGFSSEGEMSSNLSTYQNIAKMRTFWNSTNRKIQNATTTPVGNAIATININNKLGFKYMPFIL